MANMDSIERAGSYFNTDVGINASKKAQSKTTGKTETKAKTTDKIFKSSVEKYRQNAGDTA